MKKNDYSSLIRLGSTFMLLASLVIIPSKQIVLAAGIRYYVNGNAGNDSNNGKSWGQSFKTLQQALTAANAGDEVWVAKGVYYPDNGGIYPLDSRDATFILEDGVQIYGGFAGAESNLTQRDIGSNPTILSGDVDNNDTNIDGNFIADSTNDISGGNAFHVVISSGNNNTAILDGFTITAGLADSNTDPNNKSAGLYASLSSPTLRNLTFVGNYAGLGGGMGSWDGSPILVNVYFTNNFASSVGGGMAIVNGAPKLTDCIFSENVAGTSGGGGIFNSNSATELTNVTFSKNQGPYGGGMSSQSNSTPSLNNVTFLLNYASNSGGGMANWNSNPSLSSVDFEGNVSLSGGGMYNNASQPSLIFVNFTSNEAQAGGGMYNDSSKPWLKYSVFDSNEASGTGGGIHNLNGSDAVIEFTTFQDNIGLTGGGMYNYTSSPILKNVDFETNHASSNTTGGGGMYNYTSSPVLEKVTFMGNSATYAGGGIYNYDGSSPVLTDVTISDNFANNGGGMRNHFNNNQPELTNVTISSNEAQFGGGMSNDNSAPKLYNVTFSANYANQGGGMHNYQSSPELWNVTFFGNIAEADDQGGGIYNANSGFPFLRNVIIAGSTNGDCVNGPGGAVTGWYSWIQNISLYACGVANGNLGFIVGQNPKLGPLANNGGFTTTHAPLPGSPVVDKVIDNVCSTTTDQRGFDRFQDGDHNGSSVCDMGAVETPAVTFADVPQTYWAWQFIERLYSAGITGGCGNTPLIYCPENPVTRAQMAIFLERGMNGSSYTPPPATGIVFSDVSTSYWAAAWIEQLYADGITGGCGGGNYCPDNNVTREQMAIFLLRAKHGSGYTPPPATGVFPDVPASYWAAPWIEQLTAEGITSGCGGGNYCPEQPVSRAQMAVFLVRTFNLP